MKHNHVAKNFCIAGASLLVLCMANLASAQDKGCSNATLHGTYAYTSTGTITAPPELAGLVAEVGTQTFDGNGFTKATATLSSNGAILPLTIEGTYVVNPDCTGTFTLQVLSPFQTTINVTFVLDTGGDGFQAMETNTGFVITRFGKKLYPGRTT